MLPLVITFILFITNLDGGVAIRHTPAFASPVGGRKFPPKNVATRRISRREPSCVETDTLLQMTDSSTENAAATNRLLPMTAIASLSLVSLAAFTHHIPGPMIDATNPESFWTSLPYGVIFGGYSDYTPSLIIRDISSTLFSIVAAAVFVKQITGRAKDGRLESRDARKIIHTLSAPLFILVWPLFSDAFGARVFASIVPLLNALRLFIAGTGSSGSSSNEDEQSTEGELANAISRSGDAKEALGGPFIYVLILLFSTFFFWTDTPIGIVSVATMAVGDGLADLVGRRYGSANKWPFNADKSMAGSAAFVVGSFVASFGLISWLTSIGTMDPLALSPISLVIRLLIIAVICAGVELIPAGDDNWSVPISAAILSALLLI